MNKYDFIKNGNLLYWNDPDNGISSGDYKVISAPEEVYEDSIILIASDHSEAEVLASELSPIPPTRSYKEEFQKWREKHEAEGSVFTTGFQKLLPQTTIWKLATWWRSQMITAWYSVRVRYWLSRNLGTAADVFTLTVMLIGLQTAPANSL